ncbi:alpha/beta hydrolase [Clostridium sp. YIM B02515]|uniref:Alpha/beta hydrolase n=1 Tax=Clostridium rhizosphaerae TaxID=2803861 RepID=A0ABS1T9P3_9CLOT|nr:alpha/beta hydrolase [Clostridium rhizosphaerae]
MSREIYYNEKKLADESIFGGNGRFINLNGSKTYIVEKGKGENIIFLNGIAASIFTWRYLIDDLSKDFHVFGMDFTGAGLSEKKDSKYSIDIFTDQTIALMNYYNIDKTIIVGNSLGGEVALNTSLKYPHKIKGMILIDSAGYQGNKEVTKFLVKLSRLKITLKMLEFCMSRKLVKRIIRWAFYNDKIIGEDTIEGYYKPMKTKGSIEAFIELVKNLSFTEFDYEKVKSIKVPTLIIWGENDKWIPLSDGYRLNRDMIDSQLIIIEHCGHGPQEEKPEYVSLLIKNFIDNKL